MAKYHSLMKALSLLLTFAIVFTLIFGSMSSIQSSDVQEESMGFPAGWSDDINISENSTIDEYPNMAVSGNNIHTVWRNTWFGDVSIMYRNSSDAGNTWNERQQIIPVSPMLPSFPDIGVNNSNVHVVYHMWETGSWEINYINSTDGGNTWNPSKRISGDDGFNSEAPKIAVNNSNIHVIWVDSRQPFPNTEIYYNRSLDGGITWEGEQRLTNALFASAPSGIVVNGSNIHITWIDERNGNWEIYYKMSKDNGATWQDGQGNIGLDRLLTTNATDHISSSLAVNGSTIHVVWVDQEPGPVFSIYYRNSTDNGATWGSIQQLVSPFAGTAYAPELAVQNDTVHMTWHDMRDGGQPEIYYKNSTDSGATWSPYLRLTELDGFISGGPKIALSGSQRHIIWEDQRDGNKEIYYKRQPNFPESVPPTIQHIPITEANISEEITIIANITDNELIADAVLYYENVGDTTYMAVDMVLISGDTHSGNWSATIPAQTETGLVHYFIWANDTSGNNITSPIIGDYAIQITGPPSIEITSPIGDEDWTGGSIHQIEFIASDTENALAVLDVFLNYTSSSAGNGFIASIKGNDSPYDWTLPIIDATDVIVNATVVDSDGNKAYADSPQFIIDSSPPEVISSNPANNSTGISIFQPVVIQFNEIMNISSIIVNQTNGTDPGNWQWFWNEDEDTITGTHDAWPRGGNVEITIQAGYKDDSDYGNANNTDYIFSFTTETNLSPEIVHTNISSPQELGDEIRINATITDDGEVMNAVIWWMDVEGDWYENQMQRDGNNWEYVIPGQLSEGKIRYQINATDDLQQKNTTMIYEFDIEDTTSPVIVHTPVESGVIGESINITCQVTDLGGLHIVYLYYKNEAEIDTNFIRVEMNSGSWYEIPAYSDSSIIEYYIQATDIYGNDATTQVYSLEILGPTIPDTTPPEVLLATPTGNNNPISTDISIVFSEAVNQTSVEGAISISPTISGISYNWLDNQTLVIEISGNLSYNTTYTVTINSGAKDLAGNTLANDYSWQFSTVEEPEIAQQPASNDWGWIVIIISLSAIIALLLFYQLRERKEKETEELKEE